MRNLGPLQESAFSLLSQSGNRIEKPCFYQELPLINIEFYIDSKIFIDLQFSHKKCKRQQNYKNLETNRYIFSKVLMVLYHCAKFPISNMSLSRGIACGQTLIARPRVKVGVSPFKANCFICFNESSLE